MAEQTFYVGIKGVIVRGNKVLLLRANGGKGRRDIWEAPGGRIDGEERPNTKFWLVFTSVRKQINYVGF